MVLPQEYDIQEQLEKINEKIKEKYEGESIFEELKKLEQNKKQMD